MKWYCLNDNWGYCSGKPEFGEKAHPFENNLSFVVDTCKLDSKTCGKFQTLTQQLEGKSLPIPDYKVGVKGRIVKVKHDKAI